MAKANKRASGQPISDDSVDVPDHPLVAILRPEPTQSPERVLLTGFPGPATVDSRIRLYIDRGMNSYFEFSRDAVLSAFIASADDVIAPWHIVVSTITRLELVPGSVPSTAAGFLQGNIVSRQFGKAVDFALSFNPNNTVPPTCAAGSNSPCGDQ
jgi:hypothetical protein